MDPLNPTPFVLSRSSRSWINCTLLPSVETTSTVCSKSNSSERIRQPLPRPIYRPPHSLFTIGDELFSSGYAIKWILQAPETEVYRLFTSLVQQLLQSCPGLVKGAMFNDLSTSGGVSEPSFLNHFPLTSRLTLFPCLSLPEVVCSRRSSAQNYAAHRQTPRLDRSALPWIDAGTRLWL